MPTIALLQCLAAVTDSYVFVARNESKPGCSADCKATDIQYKWYWQKQEVTATITAATIVLVVDERTNTTKTETKFNELPDGITIPPTNSAGTQTTTIEVETKKGQTQTVTLTYPSEYVRYPLSYNWKGTLPTMDAMGAPVCSTAPSGGVWIDYSSYATPAQSSNATPDPKDPRGFIYSLLGFGCVSPAEASINSNDAAPQLCSSESVCGVSALETVQLLTATSVRRETSTPDSVQPPAQQPGQPQPPAQQNPQPQNPQPQPQPQPQNPAPQPAPTANNGPEQQPAPQPTPAPIVVGSQTFAANSQSNFVISGQTLSQGGQVVAGGNTISLAQGGSVAVVNGATQALRPTSAPAAITVNGQTITADSAGQFTVGGSGLMVGGSAIIVSNGQSAATVSLATDARGNTVAVINGQSSTLAAGNSEVGDAVASGMGVNEFTGSAARNRAHLPAVAFLVYELCWTILGS